METVLFAAAALACPVGMGMMMWLMARGMRDHGSRDDAQEPASLEALRDEHRRLGDRIERIERRDRTPSRS
jgi:hypothetical protein